MPQSPAQSLESQDAQLLRRVAQQDKRALEELYSAYHRRLSRFLLRLAPRHDFAEEVINDTFWVVWCKATDFRGASRVSTWILGIAYRHALHALRQERRAGGPAQAVHEDEAGIVDPGEDGDTQDWIAQGLSLLPDEQRLTLELAYFLGYSCEEIATITECPVGTVKARMFHAREKLRLTLPSLGGTATVFKS
ncbi:MAG: sigma-70 family RNA polymerase sigma factor [Steroidobacteraceae bacterium]